MRKDSKVFLFLVYLVFFKSFTFSKEYLKSELGVSDYVFAPSSVFFSSDIVFDYNRGFGRNIFNNYNITFGISRLINPEFNISFRCDNKVFEYFSFSNKLYLLKFFYIDGGFGLWNYFNYDVMEYFVKIANIFYFNYKNIFGIISYTGISYKVSAISEYYYHQLIFIYKFGFELNYKKYYQFSFSITDMSFEQVYSLGYFQINFTNKISPNRNSSIFIDFGLGYSGVGSLAGALNRIYISFGGSYEYFFFK